MVAHSLHQVAHQLGVEEKHRQFEQLNEEIAKQGDINVHAYTEQYPATIEVDSCTTGCKHQLPQKYQPDDIEVFALDAFIHNSLGQKWQYQLHATTQYQPDDNL